MEESPLQQKLINANRNAALKNVPKSPKGFSRDEYSFASTYEGGAGSKVVDAPMREQSSQGGTMNAFYTISGINDGDKFNVRIIP